jgi:hypothetical protein
MKAAVESPGWGKELTVQDVMLAALRLAKVGLRRKSIDEVEGLLEWCRGVPRENWPRGVAEFVDRFKRHRGRMRSKQGDMRRFYSDPNHVAAHLAAFYVAELRRRPGKSKRRPYKVVRSGEILTVHEDAARRAAAVVDSSLAAADASLRRAGRRPRGKRVNVDVVKSLLKRGRTKRPTT